VDVSREKGRKGGGVGCLGISFVLKYLPKRGKGVRQQGGG
jgi:hypothetical protein